MNLLDLENEKFKNVEVNGLKFKIRFMAPRDKVAITQRRLRLQGNAPVESLMNADFIFFENIAIVDVCTEEFPKELKENESCMNWQDETIINGLAEEIRSHTTDIEAKLKKNRPIDGIATK